MVTADNVGSFQMQQVRMALRGEAVVCFGKNTMMRCVEGLLEQNPGHDYKKILSSINGNTGLVFTNCPDLGKLSKLLLKTLYLLQLVPAQWLRSMLLCLQDQLVWTLVALPSSKRCKFKPINLVKLKLSILSI